MKLRLIAVVTAFVVGAASAAVIHKIDDITYLSLDEDEVEALGIRMKKLADENERLKRERKTECGLI